MKILFTEQCVQPVEHKQELSDYLTYVYRICVERLTS